MGRKLYIANLSTSVGPKVLRQTFSACGAIDTLKIVTDRATDRSKGIAFIEMSTDAEAERAIKDLNGTELEGKKISVSAAKPHKAPGKLGAATLEFGPRGRERW